MQYRRAKIPEACYFFTVNLAERNQSLFIDHAANLRTAFLDKGVCGLVPPEHTKSRFPEKGSDPFLRPLSLLESSYQRDEKIKFEIYEQEGVAYYILVYPDLLTAKVYRLDDGKYKKCGDYTNENYLFELGDCKIDFNFNNLFKRFIK